VDGVIDYVAPDLPAPTVGEKALPYPQCPSGITHGMGGNLSPPHGEPSPGRPVTLADVSPWLSQRPAELYGLPWTVGQRPIAGGVGDLTVVDLNTMAP